MEMGALLVTTPILTSLATPSVKAVESTKATAPPVYPSLTALSARTSTALPESVRKNEPEPSSISCMAWIGAAWVTGPPAFSVT